MQIQKVPLLSATICLFGGGITAYLTQHNNDESLVALAIFLVFFLFSAWYFRVFEHLRFTRLMCVGMVFFMLGGMLFQLNDYRCDPTTIATHSNTPVDIWVHVDELKREEATEQQVLVHVKFQCYGDSLVSKSGKLLLTLKNNRVAIDDELLIHGTLNPIQNLGNPGEFDAEYYYGSKGVMARLFVTEDQFLLLGNSPTFNGWFSNWRLQLGEKMEMHLDGVFLGISKALLLGDKADLDQDTMRVFTNTGSMHVLAVSGLHVGLLLIMFQKVLLLFARWISKRNALFLSLILVWMYGLLSGASPSVMRAVVMFTILGGAPLLHRKTEPMNALLLSAILLFVWDPWVIFDIGFQLSYAAMIGIFLLYEPIHQALHFKVKIIQQVWEGTAVGLAATICTTPITLFWFYQFPNYFILANVGVMLFGFLVLLFGMLFLVLQWIPLLNALVAFVFSLTIVGLVGWVSWIDGLPGAVSGGFHLNIFQLIASLVLVVAWIVFVRLKKYLLPLACLSLGLVSWISFERYHYFSQSELIVFQSNRFVTVVKTPKGSVGFYDPKRGLASVVPKELIAYEQYSGIHMTKIALEHDSIKAQLFGQQISLNRLKNGWRMGINNHYYSYQSYGLPHAKLNPSWMTMSVQKHLNPNVHFRIFQQNL
jgi:competence protein ComEC